MFSKPVKRLPSLWKYGRAGFAYKPLLTMDYLDQSILDAQYSVRGETVIKALEYANQLKQGKKLPFDEIAMCSIGNPAALGFKPLRFNRQVLSLILDPASIETSDFSEDIKDRARFYYNEIGDEATVGGYTETKGYRFVRESIARFIEKRDGVPSDIENIFLCNGAAEGVRNVLHMLLRGPEDGFMTPVPRYPQYTAEITLREAQNVEYFLDEDNNWGLDIGHLRESFDKAVEQGVKPRGIVVINPGNPTGNVLSRSNIEDIITFAHEKNILIIADEVYQENVYQGEFHSFKKVMAQMGGDASQVEMVSLHSISKGLSGECGLRGGYMELSNIDPDVMAQMFKIRSINLCSNTCGQLMMELMTNPPTLDNASQATVDVFNTDKESSFGALKQKAEYVSECFKNMTNFESNPIQGALYAFPRVHFSQKAIDAAAAAGKAPDLYYALKMIDEVGIVTTPGSGFGQLPGTHHIRFTFSVWPDERLEKIMRLWKEFNEKFHAEH
eukprot:CAMPEP_0114991426 /NCGR_PEP_ID=MMETSP0216-20121206/11365_1 /TAXON_ID=223996 /ORGANISM="Protocruzia adherens, Strain Boccale" /LENGTH=499 /DNA_ID=CAMNT_0002354751 /DNA_START=98 /DNA_END=1597 /DNA_ORIENTATION=+